MKLMRRMIRRFGFDHDVTEMRFNQSPIGFPVDFRQAPGAGTSQSERRTQTDGVATLQGITYPSDGNVYAYYAKPRVGVIRRWRPVQYSSLWV
jgi:hypothetical protein